MLAESIYNDCFKLTYVYLGMWGLLTYLVPIVSILLMGKKMVKMVESVLRSHFLSVLDCVVIKRSLFLSPSVGYARDGETCSGSRGCGSLWTSAKPKGWECVVIHTCIFIRPLSILIQPMSLHNHFWLHMACAWWVPSRAQKCLLYRKYPWTILRNFFPLFFYWSW